MSCFVTTAAAVSALGLATTFTSADGDGRLVRRTDDGGWYVEVVTAHSSDSRKRLKKALENARNRYCNPAPPAAPRAGRAAAAAAKRVKFETLQAVMWSAVALTRVARGEGISVTLGSRSLDYRWGCDKAVLGTALPQIMLPPVDDNRPVAMVAAAMAAAARVELREQHLQAHQDALRARLERLRRDVVAGGDARALVAAFASDAGTTA